MKKTIFLLSAIALGLNACATSTNETSAPQTEQNVIEPSIPKVKAPEPPPLVVEPQLNNSMSSQPKVELKTQIGEPAPQSQGSKSSASDAQNFNDPLIPESSAPRQNFDNPLAPGSSAPQQNFNNPLFPESSAPKQNFDNPLAPKTQAPIPQNAPFNNQAPQFGSGNLQSPSQTSIPGANNFQSPVMNQPQSPVGQP
jgi:hypothetical protein